jgi:hypothetical protein
MAKSGDKDSLVAEIEDIVAMDTYFRSSIEQVWFINHINYMGFQWTLIDPDTGTTEDLQGEVRFRANKIQTLIHHSVAKLTSSPPEWDVDSDTDSIKVQEAKQVAERFLEYVWDRETMPVKEKEHATALRIYGTGLLGVEWDPEAGDEITPEDIFPQGADNAGDLMSVLEVFEGDEKRAIRFLQGKESIRTGDVRISVLSPFDFHIDPAAFDMESARWCMIDSITGIDELKRRYGSVAKDVVPEEMNTAAGSAYRERIKHLVSPNVVGGGTSQPVIKDAVTLHKYFERPTTKHRRGRLVVYAGGKVLFYGDNPYYNTTAELPVVRTRDIPVPHRFWGQAALEQAIPVQRNINKSYSNIIQNDHDHAQNKWLVPRGAGLVSGALDRSSSEVVEFNPVAMGSGAPVLPQRVAPGQTPDLSMKSIELSSLQLDDIFGIHDVSKGQVPSGVSSGVAIQLLKEADDTKLGSLKAELEVSYSILGKMVLDITKRFVQEPRTFVAVMGEGKQSEIMAFQGSDLGWRNVRVEMGAKRGRIAKQQAAIELLQYGGLELFDTVEARKALFSAVGLNEANIGTESVHEKRAKFENRQIQGGVMPLLTDYQDHEIHLKVIEDWMNSLEFDDEPEPVRLLADQHRQAHKQVLAMMMQQQLQMSMLMQQQQQQQQAPAQEGGVTPQGPPGEGDE